MTAGCPLGPAGWWTVCNRDGRSPEGSTVTCRPLTIPPRRTSPNCDCRNHSSGSTRSPLATLISGIAAGRRYATYADCTSKSCSTPLGTSTWSFDDHAIAMDPRSSRMLALPRKLVESVSRFYISTERRSLQDRWPLYPGSFGCWWKFSALSPDALSTLMEPVGWRTLVYDRAPIVYRKCLDVVNDVVESC